jgi:hypothetical protein
MVLHGVHRRLLVYVSSKNFSSIANRLLTLPSRGHWIPYGMAAIKKKRPFENILIRLPKRAIAAGQAPDFTVPVYSTHTIFVLVAPSVFAASIYMCLGRIILITDGEQHSIIRGKWLTKIFVVGDVVSFLMQGAGKSSTN